MPIMSLRLMASRAIKTVSSRSLAACAPVREQVVPAHRMFGTSVYLMNEPPSSATASSANESSTSEQQNDQQAEAARADLWNQMLNTIIVDPPEKPPLGAGVSPRSSGLRGHVGVDAHGSKNLDGTQGMSGMIEQLDMDFRERPTFGLTKPSTPFTGRSVSIPNVYNNTSATLYRQLSQILNRNNVRRELRLNDRYEKPNQKRRRKRSERHRRRFADMIRKKVQLVCIELLGLSNVERL